MPAPPILAIQHVPCETIGAISGALAAAGLSAQICEIFAGQTPPRTLDGYAGLIIMGGPMSVYESNRYPFIRDELRLLEAGLHAGKAILGVCLGSQLLAAALGAKVVPGPTKEIGWYPVRKLPAAADDPLLAELPASFTALHWHGDIFQCPPGSTALLSSDLTACQGFRHGSRAYGLLCHLEVTCPQLIRMVTTFREELSQSQILGENILKQAPAHMIDLEKYAGQVFSRWTGLISS